MASCGPASPDFQEEHGHREGHGTQNQAGRAEHNQAADYSYERRDGRVIRDERDRSALAGSLSLGNASTAIVFDNAVFGATSPVAGERSRFSLTPGF